MCGGKCGIKADLTPNASVCLCQYQSHNEPVLLTYMLHSVDTDSDGQDTTV